MKIVSHIALDVETTGLSPENHDIIQLAAVEVNTDHTLGRTFNCFMAPARPKNWSAGAEGVHKITLAKALTFPPRRNGLILFMHWLAPHLSRFPLGLIYHGTNNFDPNFLKAAFLNELFLDKYEKVFRNAGIVSTCDLAKRYFSLPNYKLNTICAHLDIPLDHHEALSDAIACGTIFTKVNSTYIDLKSSLFQ